jgi:hypothetical protein
MPEPRFAPFTALLVVMLTACAPRPGGDATGEGDTTSNSGPGPVTSGECPGALATTTGGAADSSVTDATTDGGSDLCPGHPVIDACCCFDEVPNGAFFPYARVVCGMHRLCQDIVLMTADTICAAGPVIATQCPHAIDCALAALIAGKPGTISWSAFGETSVERAVHIVGDGTAYASGTFQCDVVDGLDPVEHRMLAPQAYFLECAGKPAAIDRFECVRAPFVGEPLETCVAGF